MRSACVVRTRFILHNFSGIGLGRGPFVAGIVHFWTRPFGRYQSVELYTHCHLVSHIQGVQLLTRSPMLCH